MSNRTFPIGFDARALESCSQEPIHIPSAIQPHGTLVVFREPDLVTVQAAENLGEFLGVSSHDAVGKPLSDLFEAAFVERLRSALAASDLVQQNPLRLTLSFGGQSVPFDAILHRTTGGTVLEIERAEDTAEVSFLSFYRSVRDAVGLIQSSTTVEAACQIACDQIRAINGFGRVMAYRFDADWHGTTIAESVVPGMVEYRGLRFPASDIPAQARRLYTVNWVRLITTNTYVPVRLLPALNPVTNAPLDMSHSVLRSVSPVHLEYLRNMGDAASSMSVSVVKEGELWALIACHHPEPRHVPYQVRLACEFIGRMLSHHVLTLEVQEARARREAALARIQSVIGALSEKREMSLVEGLALRAKELLELAEAGGAAILVRGHLRLVGETPTEAQVRELLPLLAPPSAAEIFHVDSLERFSPQAKSYKDKAAGALVFTTADPKQTLLVWFRPEVVRTVSWAGNPEKPVEETSVGTRIHPRRSFAVWQETVRGRSAPWEATVVESARAFRAALVTEELARANNELALSNQELDNYGYIVSHDLKEPVRGVRNYISFLQQDFGKDLQPEIRARLDQVVSLTRRMDELLDSLFHYSRVGRVALARERVDLNDVLRRVLESLNFTVESEKVEIDMPQTLPKLECDRARVGEIFFNLILNGIKYNTSDKKRIRIGYQEGHPNVFYVEDNGIGIAENHQGMVFRMFKRLHARDKFGGGTGSGLAIVRRIVEMHGGRVWIESKPNEGSKFQFTLEHEDDATAPQ